MKFSTFIILACAFCLSSSINAVSSRNNHRPVWGLQGFLGNPEEFGEVPTLNRTEGEFHAENGNSHITVEGNFEEIDQIHFPPWFRPGFLRRHRRHHRHEEIMRNFNDIIEVGGNETFVEDDYVEGNIPTPFPGPTNSPYFVPGDIAKNFYGGRNEPLRYQPTPFPGPTNSPYFPEGYAEEFYGGINGTFGNATLPFPGTVNPPYFVPGDFAEDFYGGRNEPLRNQPTPFPGPTNYPHYPEGYAEGFYGRLNDTLKNSTAPFFESVEATPTSA